MQRQWTQEQKGYIIKSYTIDGLTCTEIARKFGAKPDTISKYLKSWGIVLFQKELNSNASLKYDKRSERPHGTYSFSVRSQQLADDLAKFNIVPNKTYVVTNIVFPDNYLIDFLRGYIDGDGSIFYSNNSWHINITGHTESIIKQFQEKIDLLINKNSHNKITNYNNVYKAVWNGQDAIKLCELLYNNNHIALTRKRAKAMAAQEDKRVEDIV